MLRLTLTLTLLILLTLTILIWCLLNFSWAKLYLFCKVALTFDIFCQSFNLTFSRFLQLRWLRKFVVFPVGILSSILQFCKQTHRRQHDWNDNFAFCGIYIRLLTSACLFICCALLRVVLGQMIKIEIEVLKYSIWFRWSISNRNLIQTSIIETSLVAVLETVCCIWVSLSDVDLRHLQWR